MNGSQYPRVEQVNQIPHGERLLFFAEDLVAQFMIQKATARKWIASGRFGPTIRVGRRRAVRRERVVDWLREQERGGVRQRPADSA